MKCISYNKNEIQIFTIKEEEIEVNLFRLCPLMNFRYAIGPGSFGSELKYFLIAKIRGNLGHGTRICQWSMLFILIWYQSRVRKLFLFIDHIFFQSFTMSNQYNLQHINYRLLSKYRNFLFYISIDCLKALLKGWVQLKIFR